MKEYPFYKLAYAVLAVCAVVVFAACGSDDDPVIPPTGPVITDITADPQPVYNSTTLTCTAIDRLGEGLDYYWTIGGITNILTGSPATWNSPGIAGNYLVEVDVIDNSGDWDAGSIQLSIVSNSPWPKRGANIQSTGLSMVNTASITNTTKWSDSYGGVVSSPVVSPNGTIYVGSWTGGLLTYNSAGTRTANGGGGTFASLDGSPALGADGTIYVAMRNTGGLPNGRLYAVNPDNTAKWSVDIGNEVYNYSAPAIGADGTIYVSSLSNSVYAVNSVDGSIKWSYETGDSMVSTPAICTDGTIYVGSIDNSVYALNPDGTLKWTYDTGDGVSSSAAVGADGTVYIGSISNSLYALYPDGTLRWSYDTGDSINLSSPAIASDGTVYVGSVSNSVYAVNPNGTLKWSYETGDDVLSSPTIGADGTIYVGSNDDHVHAINPGGTVKWVYPTNGRILSSPAIGADGTIYVGSIDSAPWFHAIK